MAPSGNPLKDTRELCSLIASPQKVPIFAAAYHVCNESTKNYVKIPLTDLPKVTMLKVRAVLEVYRVAIRKNKNGDPLSLNRYCQLGLKVTLWSTSTCHPSLQGLAQESAVPPPPLLYLLHLLPTPLAIAKAPCISMHHIDL